MDVQTIRFNDDGRIPNNPKLPLLACKGAVAPTGDLVGTLKALFRTNGWGGLWVNGIYAYHHYHSTAHEVLGVAQGSVTVLFGGERGTPMTLTAGDVVVIPAGVGHCRLQATPDLRVVGAYPAGQSWDLRTGEPGERPEVLDTIRAVPLPRTDPVSGSDGPLFEAWGMRKSG